jgi:nucleotide-binding universal stress UspA family protein
MTDRPSPGVIRSILVGLDGSAEADAAVELTLRWADVTGARVVGLAIVDEPAIRRGAPVSPIAGSYPSHLGDERVVVAQRDRVERLLATLSFRCAGRGVPCDVLEDRGAPHERILLAAQAHDLVVLPRSGQFRFQVNGSRDDTVERVLRASARPVVTVPAGELRRGPVVVAYDGGTHAARALHAFRSAALEPSAEIVVVSVHESEAEAARCATRAAEYLASHDLTARVRVIASATPADESITRVVQEVDARLLVAGVRTSAPLVERLFGSVTRALLRTSDVPMFLSA